MLDLCFLVGQLGISWPTWEGHDESGSEPRCKEPMEVAPNSPALQKVHLTAWLMSLMTDTDVWCFVADTLAWHGMAKLVKSTSPPPPSSWSWLHCLVSVHQHQLQQYKILAETEMQKRHSTVGPLHFANLEEETPSPPPLHCHNGGGCGP